MILLDPHQKSGHNAFQALQALEKTKTNYLNRHNKRPVFLLEKSSKKRHQKKNGLLFRRNFFSLK